MGDVQLSTGAVLAVTALLCGMGAAIGVLFRALLASKDAAIKREQDLNADLTEILRPSLGIANNALDKVRRDQPGRPAR